MYWRPGSSSPTGPGLLPLYPQKLEIGAIIQDFNVVFELLAEVESLVSPDLS